MIGWRNIDVYPTRHTYRGYTVIKVTEDNWRAYSEAGVKTTDGVTALQVQRSIDHRLDGTCDMHGHCE